MSTNNYVNRIFSWDFDSLKRFNENYVLAIVNKITGWTSSQKKQARANIGLGDGEFDQQPTENSHRIVDSGSIFSFVRSKVTEAVADIHPITIEGDVTNAADEEDLTSEEVGGTDVIRFKDKTYSPTLFSGLGRKYLRKNVVSGVNVLTSAMVADENTIYHIQYDYDLNGQTITLPSGSTLSFEGGSISNGTVVGQNSIIKADSKIFNNVSISGTWDCDGNVIWWAEGCDWDDTTLQPINKDETSKLQSALDSAFETLIFPPLTYYVTSTLNLTKCKNLVLSGTVWKTPLQYPVYGRPKNRTLIYSDADICLLRIHPINIGYASAISSAPASVSGGIFDVSLCANYTKNAIEIIGGDDSSISGLRISTSILSKYYQPTRTGNGVYITTSNDASSKGNITDVWINSQIQGFSVGVNVKKGAKWMTDINIGGYIFDCKQGIITEAGGLLYGIIQPAFCFTAAEKENYPLIELNDGENFRISANIWDINNLSSSTNLYSNAIAISVSNNITYVDMFGHADYWKEKTSYSYISGNLSAIQGFRDFAYPYNQNIDDYTNFKLNPLCDYYLGFTKRGGSVTAKHYTSQGVEKSGSANMSNTDNMFLYDETTTDITLSSTIDSGDYVDIIVTPPSGVPIFRSVLFIAPSITFDSAIMVGSGGGGSDTTHNGIIEPCGTFADTRISFRNAVKYNRTQFIYRLFGISDATISIRQMCGYAYQNRQGINLLASYGGTTYGGIRFASTEASGGIYALSGTLASSDSETNLVPRRLIRAHATNYFPTFQIHKIAGNPFVSAYIIHIIGVRGATFHDATFKISAYGNGTLTSGISNFYIERLGGKMNIDCQLWRKLVVEDSAVVSQDVMIAFHYTTDEAYAAVATVLNPDNKIFIPNEDTAGLVSGYSAVSATEIRHSGTFSQKPNTSHVAVGFAYFCTDKQTTEGASDGITIYSNGTSWVDALGRAVS